MDRDKTTYRGHVVTSGALTDASVTEGTWVLRDLITEVGIQGVARLLEEDIEKVALWSRRGPPKRLWPILRAHLLEVGMSSPIRQNVDYDPMMNLSVCL